MARIKDLTNKKFGRLTVIKRADDYVSPSGQHLTQWLCRCECGNEVIVLACSLKSGRTTSCGCFKKEKISFAKKTHGLTQARLYKIWKTMKARCYNPNNKKYKDYGARNIEVCDEWKEDFQNFYDWSITNGYDENAERGEYTIDRIDVNKGYFPENCRWITNKEQQRNKRNNVNITINNETKCLAEWCELLNLNYNIVYLRIYRGWSIEKSLEVTS